MKNRPMVLIFAGCMTGVAAVWNEMSITAVFYFLLSAIVFAVLIRKSKNYLLIIAGLCLGLSVMGMQKYSAQKEWMKVLNEQQNYYQSEVIKVTNRDKGLTCLLKRQGYEGKILLYYSGDEDIYPGDKIGVWGSLEFWENSSNPGEFSLKNYYLSKGIYFTSFSDHIQILNYSSGGMEYYFMKCRQYFKDQIQKQYSKDTIPLVQGMLLGDKSEISDVQKDEFRESGLIHLLAVSGLHISMAGRSIYNILRKMGINFLISSFVGFLTAGFYCILTGLSVSAIRAWIMLGVYFLAQITGRPYDLLSAGAFAGILLLLKRPFYILDTGFLLSFTAVFTIGSIQQMENQYKNYVQKFLNSVKFPLYIQMGMLPMMIYIQYESPVLSFLSNCVAIPVASMAFEIAVCFLWVPYVPIHRVSDTMFRFVIWLSRLKYGMITVGKVPLFWVFIYYGILGIIINGNLKKNFTFKMIGIYSGILILLITPMIRMPAIVFMDIGQGDCVMMNTKGGMVVIDGGSSSKDHVGKYQMLPCLKYYGYRKVKIAVITHLDSDHYSGILELLEMGKIEYLGLPAVPKDQNYMKIEKIAERMNAKVFYLSKGNKISGQDFYLDIIHPQKNSSLEKNAASLVMQGEVFGYKILLTGDVEKEGEKVLKEEGLKNTEIVKIAHHGSKNSTSKEFLDIVKPLTGIISCGKNNRYGHPHQEVMKRLKEYHIKIRRTDQEGAVIIKGRN
ncbi:MULTISPECIES: DNA internalization-related competence protein ComEC/Rec2 [Anaerostipes]|uniref:DNA internalization-related competence protein ComEC/Rec2 n=1 Tax=Anaerostipes TaxID=207244 RepID=UPI00095186C1|nr:MULTISPECIES: DNA internalization-related competence protein ComEC/Rec2 [Anaerostipes]MCI5623716.1 DNA internalization-related competence protein ComEC/Rec2 [Anaerostipes sp.]MDY2726660.1 DNA internalization-related competence protein ComEC/Rec2 [Anaerostipes faecalis]OLR58656.1 DNA internalization-related competence protein ComEC/Rec2 [Anaerostipes sp. 494a]